MKTKLKMQNLTQVTSNYEAILMQVRCMVVVQFLLKIGEDDYQKTVSLLFSGTSGC